MVVFVFDGVQGIRSIVCFDNLSSCFATEVGCSLAADIVKLCAIFVPLVEQELVLVVDDHDAGVGVLALLSRIEVELLPGGGHLLLAAPQVLGEPVGGDGGGGGLVSVVVMVVVVVLVVVVVVVVMCPL